MIRTIDNHMIIKNRIGKKKTWNLQNSEISMLSVALLFSDNLLW